MSRLLVDTHALLWWLADDPRLPGAARELLADPGNDALVSTASLWEVAIKRRLGKLTVEDDFPAVVTQSGFAWLPVSPAHAWAVHDLPLHHRDPFDRLLVVQATLERVAIVTGDEQLAAYGVDVRWR